MKKPAENLNPVRSQPLPWELPGAHYLNEEEVDAVTNMKR